VKLFVTARETCSSGCCFDMAHDTTNAFKAYRRHVIEGWPTAARAAFSTSRLTPAQAIVRGYTWTITPISGKPEARCRQGSDQGKMGKPCYFFIWHVCLAGEVFQPRRTIAEVTLHASGARSVAFL